MYQQPMGMPYQQQPQQPQQPQRPQRPYQPQRPQQRPMCAPAFKKKDNTQIIMIVLVIIVIAYVINLGGVQDMVGYEIDVGYRMGDPIKALVGDVPKESFYSR